MGYVQKESVELISLHDWRLWNALLRINIPHTRIEYGAQTPQILCNTERRVCCFPCAFEIYQIANRDETNTLSSNMSAEGISPTTSQN